MKEREEQRENESLSFHEKWEEFADELTESLITDAWEQSNAGNF